MKFWLKIAAVIIWAFEHAQQLEAEKAEEKERSKKQEAKRKLEEEQKNIRAAINRECKEIEREIQIAWDKAESQRSRQYFKPSEKRSVIATFIIEGDLQPPEDDELAA